MNIIMVHVMAALCMNFDEILPWIYTYLVVILQVVGIGLFMEIRRFDV